MKRAALLMTLPLTLLLFGPAPGAWACSCAVLSQQEYRDLADVVFVGVVVGARDPGDGEQTVSSMRPIRWRFEVRRAEKGRVHERVVVESAADEASCGYPFRTGRRYRVFATEHDGRLSTGACTGTEDLGAASGPAEPARSPQPDPAPSTPGSDRPDATPTRNGRPLALPGTTTPDAGGGSRAPTMLAAALIVLAGFGLLARRRLSRP